LNNEHHTTYINRLAYTTNHNRSNFSQGQDTKHPLSKVQQTTTATMCQCQCPNPSDNINDTIATQLVSDSNAAIIFAAACLLYLSYKMLSHGVKAGLESALFGAVWLMGRLVGVFEWICRAAYRDLTALA
jgi:hypothetical protein